MKRLFFRSAVFIGSLLCGINAFGQCPNLNFSLNSFMYWQAYVGNATTSGPNLHASNPITGQHTLINYAQSIQDNTLQDEKCRLIQKVPDGYSYSCKLGNDGTGKGAEGLEYTLTVDSNNSLLILAFAYVLQQAGHSKPEQPTFKMNIRDTNGNIITSLGCSDVTLAANNTDPDLVCRANSSSDPNGKDWTTVGFSLEPLIGRTIKIRFETMDCTQSAHYGYAYFIAECRPMTIDLMYCEGSSAARLRAPEGFMTYTWTRSSDPSWRNNRMQINIQDPLDGEEFECEVSSKLGCTSKLRTIIAKTSIDASFYYGIRTGEQSADIYDKDGLYTNKYDTCTRTATMVDLSTVHNSKKDKVIWEIHGLNAYSTDSLFTYTFPDPPTNEPIDYLIRMTLEAENGCADTSDVLDEHWIRIYPSPLVEILGPERMCEGLEDTLIVQTLRSYFVHYEWGGISQLGKTISGIGEKLPITGPGTYWVKALDSVGCYAYDTIEVEPLSPTMDIKKTDILCYGDRTGVINHGPITGSGIIENAYWILKDINGNDSIDNATKITGKRYTDLMAGTYTFYAVDVDGCKLQYSVEITQPPLLQTECFQEPTTCFLPNGSASVTVTGGTPPYSYQWIKIADGSEVGRQSAINDQDSGYYKVFVKDANDCTTEDSIQIRSIPSPTISVTSVGMETCNQSNGYASIAVKDAKLPITYTWTPNPSSSTNESIQNVTGGRYHIKITDADECTAETDIEVPSYPSLVLSGNATPETCHRQDGTITTSVTSGNPNSVSYVWTSGSGGQMRDTTPNISSLPAGQYRVTVTDTFCTAQRSFEVVHIDGPTANFDANSYSVASTTVITFTDQSKGNLSAWNWDMGDGTTTTGDLVYHSYGTEGDYKVFMQVIDVNGCTDTISKMVHIYDELNVFIPNSFSPNGDDLNDTWGPVMSEYAPNGYKMVIYDRWGQRIFVTEDPNEKWDGTVNGKIVAPNSVYSYIIVVQDFTGQEYEFVGHVTVLK